MYQRRKLLTQRFTGLDAARRDAWKIERDLDEETFDAVRKHARQHR